MCRDNVRMSSPRAHNIPPKNYHIVNVVMLYSVNCALQVSSSQCNAHFAIATRRNFSKKCTQHMGIPFSIALKRMSEIVVYKAKVRGIEMENEKKNRDD